MITCAFGTSMKPTLGRMNLIRIKKFSQYKIGDIISVKTHDKKIHVHRIVEITDQWVSTKGDNLSQQWYEVKLPLKNIEGKLIWHYPE